MTLPSSAEVEHADWPALKAFATELGLNPKGRSGIVRQRVLDHVRIRTGGPSWRAGTAEQAALLTRIGPADLAAHLWESTITLDAPAPWVGLGTSYLKAGRIEEALKCYDRAIGMGDAGARLHRAQALMRAGRSDAAIAEVDRALGANPENVRAWAVRAVLLEAAGRAEEALASQGKIADLGRGHLGLAKAHMRAGGFEDALKAIDAHLEGHPDDALAWNQRGVCQAKRGLWREAVEALRQAASLRPKDAGILNNLAVALASTERAGEATKKLAAARRISEDPRIMLNEAALFEREGSPAKARETISRVVHIAPEHPEAVAAWRRLAPGRSATLDLDRPVAKGTKKKSAKPPAKTRRPPTRKSSSPAKKTRSSKRKGRKT